MTSSKLIRVQLKQQDQQRASKQDRHQAVDSQELDPSLTGFDPQQFAPAQILQLQRIIGNQSVIGLMRSNSPDNQRVQRADATTDASTPAPKSYPDIDALDLNETAKAAAIKLKEKYPEVIFTSGRRDFSEQAHAMAKNIVEGKDRKWVEKTYAKSSTSTAVQKWIDDNPTAVTIEDLSAGIQKTVDPMTDKQKAYLSKHPAGAAFDVQPQEKDAAAIKTFMKALPGGKFLEKEGDLIRWHVEF